jgi:outer membrane protein
MRTIATLTLALALPPAAHAQTPKIGYVDMERALNETEDGKQAKTKLQGMFKEKQTELDRRQEEFKKAKDDYDKQKVMLKPDVQQKREKDLQDRFVELQAVFMKLQKELAQAEAEATKDIFARLTRIIAKVAERDGFAMVLEKSESRILWARPSMDLTNEIIRGYNSGQGK